MASFAATPSSAGAGASARPLDRRRRSMRARSESDTSTPSVARASRSMRSGSGALRASRPALCHRCGAPAGGLARLWRCGPDSGARAAAPVVVRQVRAALPLFQTPRPPHIASRRAFLALRAAILSASVLIFAYG